MAIFFFVVGLEIKRELIDGALSDRHRAALPVFAALGGMLVPAGLYSAVVLGGDGASGWGIPMATDIAFAMAVLSLTPAPHELKVLLLALAIVDDIGAILVIAVFYTAEFSAAAAGVAALAVGLVLIMQRAGFQHMAVYFPVGLIFWLAVLESGVHATIAGVILGALTPYRALYPHAVFVREIRRLDDRLEASLERGDHERTEMIAAQIEELARESESPLERAERLFHPWSSYAILPAFALANSGVTLSAERIQEAWRSPVAYGVVLGLVVGKPVGIVAFGWLAARIGLAHLPEGLEWRQVAAAGIVAGIGFAVSLFITELALTDARLITSSKIAIFAASLMAAAAGWMAARRLISS